MKGTPWEPMLGKIDGRVPAYMHVGGTPEQEDAPNEDKEAFGPDDEGETHVEGEKVDRFQFPNMDSAQGIWKPQKTPTGLGHMRSIDVMGAKEWENGRDPLHIRKNAGRGFQKHCTPRGYTKIASGGSNSRDCGKSCKAEKGNDRVGCIKKKSRPNILQQQIQEIEERQSESRIVSIMLNDVVEKYQRRSFTHQHEISQALENTFTNNNTCGTR